MPPRSSAYFAALSLTASCFLLSAPAGASGRAKPQTEGPATVVEKLYREVVARQPLGIPTGADKKAIWPFLSQKRARQLETAKSCEDDYYRLHRGSDEKPEFGWLEFGLFSGGNEEAAPAEFQVERTEALGEGTYQVHLRLTYRETFETYGRPPDPKSTFHWPAAVVVISEKGRFLVDDVLLFARDSTKVDWRLSQEFAGCDGPRWVGETARK